MWKKSDSEPQGRPTEDRPKPRASQSGATGGAVIGNSIKIDGEVSGDEDLVIHGRVKGRVKLPGHKLRIGSKGRLEARARARSIEVEGHVKGDLIADQEIVIRRSGKVEGNLVAPRVGLEEGARFKGSIDMEPGSSARSSDVDRAQHEKRKPDASSASENKATG